MKIICLHLSTALILILALLTFRELADGQFPDFRDIIDSWWWVVLGITFFISGFLTNPQKRNKFIAGLVAAAASYFVGFICFYVIATYFLTPGKNEPEHIVAEWGISGSLFSLLAYLVAARLRRVFEGAAR